MKHYLLICLVCWLCAWPTDFVSGQRNCKFELNKLQTENKRLLLDNERLAADNRELHHYAAQLEQQIKKSGVTTPGPDRPAIMSRIDNVSQPANPNTTSNRPRPNSSTATNQNLGSQSVGATSPKPNTVANQSGGNAVISQADEDKIRQYQGEVEDRILNPGGQASYFGKELNLFGNKVRTYVIDLQDPKVGIDLFYKDNATQQLYHDLYGIQGAINQGTDGRQLIFGTNAGMFNVNHKPVGLYVENRIEQRPLVPSAKKGSGNFYLRPNGVFFVDTKGVPGVMTTEMYEQTMQGKQVNIATQSGPMLVHGGDFNSKLMPGSRNLNIRSGVGVINNRYLVFAISTQPINFYNFARVFKDVYGCKDALYLDGAISKVLAPGEGWNYRQDQVSGFAAMIGVYTQQ